MVDENRDMNDCSYPGDKHRRTHHIHVYTQSSAHTYATHTRDTHAHAHTNMLRLMLITPWCCLYMITLDVCCDRIMLITEIADNSDL
jgi:hypothetical protein